MSELIFAAEPPVATVTFNRPEARNALTWQMYQGLVDACEMADASDDIRVLVIRGAGGRAFAAGTDISQFTSFARPEDGTDYERRLDGVIDRLERVRKVTIAQVQGVATGGGCAIALTCDLRVCSPDARFGMPIARTLGNCLSIANTARLIDALGAARFKDLIITARLMDVEEASRLGLVARVAEADALEQATRELALTVAEHAPLTIQVTKEALRRIADSRRPAQGTGDDLVSRCYGSADFQEGVAAFLAKRTPRWTGK